MRITIETEDGGKAQGVSTQADQAEVEGGTAEGDAAVSPPAELAARAAAIGAVSAGPAPSEMVNEGPVSFVEAPGTPATAPQGGRTGAEDISAGGAPEFAAGEVHSEEIEAGTEEEEDEG